MTKPRYERPVLVRHEVGGPNKFGVQPSLRVFDRFEGVPIADLVAKTLLHRDLKKGPGNCRAGFPLRESTVTLAGL